MRRRRKKKTRGLGPFLLLAVAFCCLAASVILQKSPRIKAVNGGEGSSGSVSAGASSAVSSKAAVSSPSPVSSDGALQSEGQPLLSLDQTVDGIEPNGLISLKLIDISNGVVVSDWKAVKQSVDGIYIKATEGTTYTNPQFASLAKGAIGAGIPVGFYHYFWPRSDPSYGKKQADFFYNAIKPYGYKFYPVIDIEEKNGQDPKTVAENVKAFLKEFKKKSGRNAMCYCSPSFANQYLADKDLAAYPLWIANYNVNTPKKTTVWKTFDVWQYGVAISVPGMSGQIDGDIATDDIFLDKNAAPKM